MYVYLLPALTGQVCHYLTAPGSFPLSFLFNITSFLLFLLKADGEVCSIRSRHTTGAAASQPQERMEKKGGENVWTQKPVSFHRLLYGTFYQCV